MSDPRASIEAVWRLEAPKLIATLTRLTRDVGLAEDLAQDALVAALEQWPAEGVPRNPAAWLMTTARRRGIDRIRHHALAVRKHQELGYELEALETSVPDIEGQLDDAVINDDLLRLIFIACHPVLAPEGRVALSLRLLGGLTTEEIARAFLVPEPTIAQRIVRAKKTLAAKQVRFEVPHGDALAARLASVLNVIYLIFNEGYSATAGDDWLRPTLCEDALRLGRMLAQLMPDEADVHGLVALMEIQASRSTARVGAAGEPVLLLDQQPRPVESAAHSPRSCRVAAGGGSGRRGRCFCPASWNRRLPRACASGAGHRLDAHRFFVRKLAEVMPSPIVELNRAVAVGMASGPEAGLALLDSLAPERVLEGYHRVPSVRGDFLAKLGRRYEAKMEFERAAAMTSNRAERTLLEARARECTD